MAAPRLLSRTLPAALLIVSGACALAYEVLWAGRLAVLLGGTAQAQAAVLGIFLAGLAVGGLVIGRLADSSRSPLALYGLLELGAALLAAASPAFLDAAAVLPAAGRWAAAAAIILPPSALLGGALPALTRWATRSIDEISGAVSGFAAANALGAAAGALAAGFWLEPRFGIAGALRVAALANAAAGLAALALSWGEAVSLPSRPMAGTGTPLSAALWAAGLAGAVTLILETAWIRMLALSLGGTTHAFAIMTAAFILGLSAGALAVQRGWLSGRKAAEAFVFCQLGAALALLAGFPIYARLPYLSLAIGSLIPRQPAFYPAFEAARFMLCLAAAAPPAFFAGAAMPFAARSAAREDAARGRAVGAAYAANALGNAAGAALGLALLPVLGLAGLLTLAAAGTAAAGALLAGPRRRAALAAAAAGVAVAAALGPLDARILSSGSFRAGILPGLTWADFRDGVKADRLLFHRDDRQATVTVVENPQGIRYLKINGKTDASDGDDMGTQALLAHIPLTLQPTARDALIVGLGSGVTAAAALRHPLTALTILEISPAVVEAAHLFEKAAGKPLEDPRAHLILTDAGLYLRGQGPSYDLIISEPSNPWMAGVSGLFTADFYAAAHRRLKPGGSFVQWFHLYEMSDEALALVLRTFTAAFPEASAWDLGTNDILLLGSDVPLAAGEGFEAAAARGASDLESVGIHGPAALLSMGALSGPGLRRLAGEGPLHTDDRPLLAHLAPKALFLDRVAQGLAKADERRADGIGPQLRAWLKLRGRGLSATERKEILAFHRRWGGTVLERLAPN